MNFVNPVSSKINSQWDLPIEVWGEELIYYFGNTYELSISQVLALVSVKS